MVRVCVRLTVWSRFRREKMKDDYSTGEAFRARWNVCRHCEFLCFSIACSRTAWYGTRKNIWEGCAAILYNPLSTANVLDQRI
jgi:hypothetical protein